LELAIFGGKSLVIGNHSIHSLKRFFAILGIDLFLYNAALLLSLFLLFNCKISHSIFDFLFVYMILSNILFLFFSFAMHTPYEMWEFTSIKEASIITAIVSATKFILIPYYFLMHPSFHFALSLFIINLFVTIPLLLTPRILFRVWKESKRVKEIVETNATNHSKQSKRILIIGAGSAGEKIAREIGTHPELCYQIIGFLDDDPLKHNSILRGNRVFGSIKQVSHFVETLHIDEVLIAIPSADGSITRHILSALSSTNAIVRTLPGIWEMVAGIVNISSIRNIKVEDLLEREAIKTNVEEIASYLKNKVVLITGAGGSIGSELTRQVAKYSPKMIIMLGRGENRIFKINNEIKDMIGAEKSIPMIADIRDINKMNWLLKAYKPDIIFHAAAHKHVPLMEQNPDEAFTNNVMATWNLLKLATVNRVKLFINISTDKAVNPINVMGASKRIVELLTKSYNSVDGLITANVRFGNVLGSEGSVLQVFQKQLQDKREIQVTDAKMERYFMLIPEAVELVLQAGALTKGDELFVLKMGKQINILEFAKSFIKLSGLELNKDAKIVITGNRGAEKLSEELWYPGSEIESTPNPWIVKVASKPIQKDIQKDIQNSPLYHSGIMLLSADEIKREMYQLLEGDIN
jgi:FlaA1/EpsC-like NDP-sugar epimerase